MDSVERRPPSRFAGRGRAFLELAFLAGLAVMLLERGSHLMAEFPASYTWSELLIDYEGGFVRRGLLGEAAFRLNGLVPPRDVLGGAVLLAYGGLAVGLVALARRADPLAAALFLASPVGLLFPFYDDAAFGRKDVFIALAFVASALLAARASKRAALAGLLAIYLVAGLVVETAWLYAPLAVALYLAHEAGGASQRWRFAVWIGSWAVLGIVLLGTVLANAPLHDPAVARAHEHAMVEAWRAIYPDAYADRDALQWVGMSLKEGISMALYGQGRRNTALGWTLGFVLAQLPTVLLLLRSEEVQGVRGSWLATSSAFGAMSLTFLVGADWGRYIHLWTLHAFVFVASTRRRLPQEPGADRSAVLVAAALVVLYGSAWRLKHYVWDGDSALVPGALFRLVRSTPR